MPRQTLSVLIPLLALSFAIAPAQAQIVPSAATTPGATGTIVTPGSEINITGGQTAGTNLFHSFSQFGLTQSQIANFQTTAEIKNVLARVNGGNPSVIDGLLKLTGSNASLYLMNPAGIIFGNNAQINIPGSFVATTATNIGIGSGMFNAIGPNAYVSGTPSSFVFQPGARGAIVNTAGNPDNFASGISYGYNPPSTGEKSTFALIGNTVLDLAGIRTAKDNIALFSIPENSSLTFFGSNGQIGVVDFNTIVKPPAGETIINRPTFDAFKIPTLVELATLSRQTDRYYGNSIKSFQTTEAGNIFLSAWDVTIKPGDIYSSNLITDTSKATPAIGSISILSDQTILLGDVIQTRNNIRLNGKSIRFTQEQMGAIGSMNADNVEIFAKEDIDVPSTIRGNSIRIETLGDVKVGGLHAVVPVGTPRNAEGGNLTVRANTLQVTDMEGYTPGFAEPFDSLSGFSGPTGSFRFSILASGTVSIEQIGVPNGKFIEGTGLERDTSGSVIYRLISNPSTRVTIAGVRIPEGENLIPYLDLANPAGMRTVLKDVVTGELIPYDGHLVLKNVATSELIQGDSIFIQYSKNPLSLSGGGTKGLIGRLDKSSGILVELSGTTKPVLPSPLDQQHPAMISVTSQTGSTSLANPIGGAIPGSYSNVPGLASVVKTPLALPIPAPQPQGNTPDPVLYTPTIEPSPISIIQPTNQAAQSALAPTQSEVILYHRPVLSGNATRGILDTGILKIEIDPREEGILTLYRQPITQTISPETKTPTQP